MRNAVKFDGDYNAQLCGYPNINQLVLKSVWTPLAGQFPATGCATPADIREPPGCRSWVSRVWEVDEQLHTQGY